jgi:hypothetical protein
MADGKDIDIRIKTTADTSGVEKTAKSLDFLEDAAIRAQKELDVIEAKRRVTEREKNAKGGLLGVDVTEAAGKAGQKLADSVGYGKEFETISKLLGAHAADVAGAFAGIGIAAVKSYQALQGTVDGYKTLMDDAAKAGQSLGPEIEQQVATLEQAISPIAGIIEFIGNKWDGLLEVVKNPVDSIAGLSALREALEREAELTSKLQLARLKIANENQGGVSEIYEKELKALLAQEESIKRIAALRNGLATLQTEAARQEVESAKLRGGDVQLAQANQLSAELDAGLSRLGDNLRSSVQQAEIARAQLDAAMVAHGQALKDQLDQLDPEKYQGIVNARQDAEQAFSDAQQAVTDQQQLFEATKTNLLRGVENSLAELDLEAGEATSKASENARSAIYNRIRAEFGSIQTGGDEVIRQEADATKQALATERQGTVKAIQQLAPQEQDTSAIVKAVTETATALQSQGTSVLSAVSKLMEVASGLDSKTRALEAQVQQLSNR